MSHKQRRHRQRDDHDDDERIDEVTEAGLESFPASDPPAYNTPGRGKSNGSEPDDEPKDEDRPPHDG
jgi:hypothetical protein